jgi:hypothetical protein
VLGAGGETEEVNRQGFNHEGTKITKRKLS